jgi:hypothetical protein
VDWKRWVFGWGSREQEFQHGFHAPVVQVLSFACFLAGGLHLGVGILVGEVQDAQTGAESLFGMSLGGQDRLNRLAGECPCAPGMGVDLRVKVSCSGDCANC